MTRRQSLGYSLRRPLESLYWAELPGWSASAVGGGFYRATSFDQDPFLPGSITPDTDSVCPTTTIVR